MGASSTHQHRLVARWLSVACTLAGLLGCSDSDGATSSTASIETNGNAGAGSAAIDDDSGPTESEAADLRVELNLLLSEHVILTAKATGAALGGREQEFNAYYDELKENGTEIGDEIGESFGDEAEAEFNRIWSAHDGFFVDYTTAVGSGNADAQAEALDKLTNTYVPEFSRFLAQATGLPEDELASLTAAHVATTQAIIDAQAEAQDSQDWAPVYTAIRAAFAHMVSIGDPVSQAIAQKKPDEYPGDPATKAVDLRVALNQLLQEHLYLATFATGAALGGRTEEFTAANAALNSNGSDLGAAIGTLYGADAENTFIGIWAAHNAYFVNYTQGVANNDEAAKSAAVDDLTTKYVPDFARFLADATGLDENTLQPLIAEHVTMTKAVVDAQAAGDWKVTADTDVEAADQMEDLADPLAAAIVAKFPDMF